MINVTPVFFSRGQGVIWIYTLRVYPNLYQMSRNANERKSKKKRNEANGADIDKTRIVCRFSKGLNLVHGHVLSHL